MIRKVVLLFCVLMFACAPVPVSPAAPADADIDVELEAAIQQARDSLDLFVARIAIPHDDRPYVALKVRFTPPGELPQDIWVDGVTYEGGIFRGIMGDDLPTLRLEIGEEIKIEAEDIVDWMLVEDGKLIGGYTIRLAARRMSPEERERFLDSIDYSIED